jgi:hypothetical protein
MPTSLSPDGRRRRQEILVLAEQALGDRVRRGRARRAGSAALALAAAAALVLWALPRSGGERDTPPDRPGNELVRCAPHEPSAASLGVPFEVVDDDRLVAALREAGYEVGAVRVGASFELVDANGRALLAKAESFELTLPTRPRSSGEAPSP